MRSCRQTAGSKSLSRASFFHWRYKHLSLFTLKYFYSSCRVTEVRSLVKSEEVSARRGMSVHPTEAVAALLNQGNAIPPCFGQWSSQQLVFITRKVVVVVIGKMSSDTKSLFTYQDKRSELWLLGGAIIIVALQVLRTMWWVMRSIYKTHDIFRLTSF